MDLDEEAVRSWRGCSPHRPCEAREVGLIFISEDPRLVRVMGIPITECSSKASANVPETRRKFTKDVKSNGTNLRSPLESTKLPKKRTQKACKRGRKMCQEYAKKLKRSERATPKGQILDEGSPRQARFALAPLLPRREGSSCRTLRREPNRAAIYQAGFS